MVVKKSSEYTIEMPTVQNMKTPNSTRKSIWARSKKNDAPKEENAPDRTENPTSACSL